MKKKLLMLAVFIAAVSIVASHHDLLQMMVNFVVAGVVPGLNISLGFLPTIGVIGLLLLIMRRLLIDLRFQMVRRTALEMNAENTKRAMSSANTIERRERRRAVIAAPGLETN